MPVGLSSASYTARRPDARKSAKQEVIPSICLPREVQVALGRSSQYDRLNRCSHRRRTEDALLPTETLERRGGKPIPSKALSEKPRRKEEGGEARKRPEFCAWRRCS
eukprot:scaffold1616_cov310-Pinguiococcus_pyrenoidosus.AAC.19